MNLLENFNLVILNETLVEKLFDLFEDDFKLENSYRDWTDLEKYMQDNLKKYNIKITINKVPGYKEVGGEYRAWSNEIIMTVPDKKYNPRYLQKFTSVFFHEFAHHIKEEEDSKAAGRFNPVPGDLKNYTEPVNLKLVSNPYGFYGLFLEGNNSNNLMNQMIKYWTQQHERSNIAFSIAYDLYDDTKQIENRTFDSFIKRFDECWINYHKTGDHSFIDVFIEKLHPGTMILFALIFYRQELLSKRQMTRENIQNVQKTIGLAKKYYVRIERILGPSKAKI